MANKPTETLGWAISTVNETAQVGNSIITVTNAVEPTYEVKQSGLKAREPLARPYFNWITNFLMRWVDNLDTRTSSIGKIEITTDSTRTETDYENEFGGTWIERGTDTLAGVSVVIFERTA